MFKLINKIKSFFRFKKPEERYGCAMLRLNFDQDIRELQFIIDKNDLYIKPNDHTYGLAKDPHVTLLYGLNNDVKPELVGDLLNLNKFRRVRLHNISLFENEVFEVLKFDVEDLVVLRANDVLKQLPHTKLHDQYNPHVTVAYLKPGLGQKYVNSFKNYEYWVSPLYIVYSDVKMNETKIPIDIV
jgi:2'-5' RNA ligase